MSIENLEKVKDRIAKLLAKANNNSNEHEAEIAASRARALMDKYQLDEMDISAHAGVDLFGVEISDEVYAYIPRWKDWLGVITAKPMTANLNSSASTQTKLVLFVRHKSGKAIKKMWRWLSKCTNICAR